MKLRKKLIILCTSAIIGMPTLANAQNKDVPFYNGNDNTFLRSGELQMPGKYFRAGSEYAPAGVDLMYKGDLHYPAVYITVLLILIIHMIIW